jgi:hypothetical protein
MLANLKIICQFHAHSVHQNTAENFWAEIYRGQLFFRAEIYSGRLLTFITGLLRIRFSADLTMYSGKIRHDKIRTLYFDSAHNKTVQHKL